MTESWLDSNNHWRERDTGFILDAEFVAEYSYDQMFGENMTTKTMEEWVRSVVQFSDPGNLAPCTNAPGCDFLVW